MSRFIWVLWVFLVSFFLSACAASFLGIHASNPKQAKALFKSKPSIPLSSEDIAKRALLSTVEVRTSDDLGSGFVISKNVVVTNLHVVAGYSGIYVKLPPFLGLMKGKKIRVVDIRALDAANDLVLLDVPGIGLKPLPLSDVNGQPGSRVLVAGAPEGFGWTISSGVISNVNRLTASGQGLLQIDAPISPGCSGGPVLDKYGKVIGIVRMIYKDGENINFAVPIRYLKDLMHATAMPISLDTFAATTKAHDSNSDEQGGFPKAVAGFKFGSSISDVDTMCHGHLHLDTNNSWASCPFQPVQLPMSSGSPLVYLGFSAGKLTSVAIGGTSWADVFTPISTKYGLPDKIDYYDVKNGWAPSTDGWDRGKAGRAIWKLDGGTLSVESMNGSDFAVLYVSDLKFEIQNDNY